MSPDTLRQQPPAKRSPFLHPTAGRRIQANNLIEGGKKHVAAEDWNRLDGVIGRLYSLLPEDVDVTEKDANRRYYTGIS
jgi:hypothetical protein